MYSKIAILSALAGIAAAAPAPLSYTSPNTNQFVAVATAPHSLIQNAPINASAGGFFINAPTAVACSLGILECGSVGEATVFSYNTYTKLLSLATLADNTGIGQQVFVDEAGSLGFTLANSQNLPEDALPNQTFEFTPQASENQLGQLTYQGRGFAACRNNRTDPNTGALQYRIYAAAVNSRIQEGLDCIDFSAMATSTWTGVLPWQYV